MKKTIALLALIGLLILSGCTDNSRARHFGGSMTETLPKGEKLVNVTWKEGGSLWILTKPMKDTDTAETYKFQEKSSWGLVQGSVTIVESK